MTPDNCGDSVCFLISRLYRTSTETWKKFDPLSMRDEDKELFARCKEDGLLLGEWITIPDPWEDDWPFAKRYPGRRCPPDPDIEEIEERTKKAEMHAKKK
ncbi:hypothetical protein BT96DRAFT_913621, partial [Gymnopus androsaceus JB14]